ncbi:MAG: glucuronate isomerase [Phycisphaerae bacterium]
MTDLESRLYRELAAIQAIDCHSHVPPESPHARGLADLLGYHYYTELAHSAGMPAGAVADEKDADSRVAEMVLRLETIDNTVQYAWLMEALRALFDFRADRLTGDNWPEVDQAIARAAQDDHRYREVLAAAHIEKVFLTNAFDADLAPVDREVFVPCLRADDLVFRLADAEVRRRLAARTGVDVASADDLRDAVRALVRYFVEHGAGSAAISLPPDFVPAAPDEGAADAALARAAAGKDLSGDERQGLAVFVFDALADACRQFRKPFQLMIGVLRNVYPAGVAGGRDLLAKTGTLHQYADLFRRYPEVDFTVSILSRAWAHELATLAWIFPNVKPSGHWWYLNVPVHIEYELRARLEAVPKGKLIGYYSDMYKVEFGLPKFNMYRRVLARVLAREFVEAGRMTEDGAVATARLLLRENPERIFGV